jgi:hypothetical protein
MAPRSGIEQEILKVLSRSPLPEDYRHALNVRDWVRRLEPDAGTALQLAALCHDIERAFPERKVLRDDYASYDDFKRAHASNSARITRELLLEHSLDKELVERVCFLVRHHEFGYDGDPEVTVLKDADSLSFFDVNVLHYLQREGEAETLRRMRWGYRRLSDTGKQFLADFRYRDGVLSGLLQKLLVSEKAGASVLLKGSVSRR